MTTRGEPADLPKADDFSFKMPTKLLGSTLGKSGKSDTYKSSMLSYKFTKENVFYPEQMVDRDGEGYMAQLKSLQDTMKSIREMDEHDRESMAAFGWEDTAVKRSAAARSSAQKSTLSKRYRGRNKHNASVDSIDYELSSSDDDQQLPVPGKEAFRDDLEVTIARDIIIGASPAKTDISDAKTSDITKVS